MQVRKSFKTGFSMMLALMMTITSFASVTVLADSNSSNSSKDANTLKKAITYNQVYQLSSNWKIQSSAIATQTGDAVSTNGYNTNGWFNTSVPNTVMGALIEAGDIEDPFIHDRISRTDESRYNSPWWYRTEFTLPASEQGKRILVNFLGIGYQADIWVNGTKIANKNDIIGSFRAYELDITNYVTADGTTKNTLAVEVTKSKFGEDFSVYWVDWVPRPTDNNMGLWRDVFITTSGDVTTRSPFVTSKVTPDLSSATLSAYVDVSNYSTSAVSGTLEATITDPSGTVLANVSKPVTINAGVKDQEVAFKADQFSALTIENPQLWWPINMGDQPMHTVEFKFTAENSSVSDRISQRFGIRELTTEMNVSPSTKTSPPLKDMVQFYVNHKPVLIKAGGYSPTDLYLRRDMDANIAVVDYLVDMGLNGIRDEGIFFDDRLIDLMDEKGLLYMGGWTCCSKWQEPADYTDRDLEIVSDSLDSQLRALRVHPSMIAWMNGSDNPASYSSKQRGREVEQAFLDIENRNHWDEYGAIISSGSAKVATLTGTTSGMHMDASYDYAPPAMWFEDMDLGGAFGFTSEAGPGPSIPVVETMKKILPESALWPYNVGGDNYQQWNFHNARGSFRDLSKFNTAMDNHYGESHNLEEYNIKAQVQQYDSQRAVFEALNANKYTKASGWVQWMLNNAWPSMFWNLFDNYLNPNGSYFGAKKGNEPLHIMFDYASKEVKVINSTLEDYKGLKASVQIYNIDSTKVYDKVVRNIAVKPDGASAAEGGQPKKVGYQTINFGGKIKDAYGITKIDKLDEASLPLSPTYFLRLELRDASGKLVSVNSYAQTLKKDVMRYQNHGWNFTPQDQFADFTALNTLKATELKIVGTPDVVTKGQDQSVTYTVRNNGDTIAYAVFAKIKKGDSGELVAPVTMEDNYFMLLPGEERTLTATYKLADLGNASVALEVNAYNNIVTKQSASPVSVNLATGKTATASSTQGSNTAGRALESSMFTKWQSSTNASTGADPQWYKVDLGKSTNFSRAIVKWEYANYAKNLIIEGSDDNASWETLYTGTNSNGSAVSDLQFDTANNRYIRLTMSGKRPLGPQIGPGGTGNGVIGLGATPASTSFNILSFEVYGPAATLTGAKSAVSGGPFDLVYGLSDIGQNGLAQDLTISYDDTKVEFVDVQSLKDGFQVIDKSVEPGKVRIIAANLGTESADGSLLKLSWKAKSPVSGVATFALTDVVIANRDGLETGLGGAAHSVTIGVIDKAALEALISNAQSKHDAAVEGTKAGQYPAGAKALLQEAIHAAQEVLNNPASTQQAVEQATADLNEALEAFLASVNGALPGDFNGDDKVTIGDLAIVAGYYGKTSDDPQWDDIKKYDFNRDGKIDIVDLVAIATIILQTK
ncbi:hypothetical protein EBB07_02605 [Paenibacillaceae bacterium]|nr:hypothetical protein EBB07_02605 [Paenibacillaceae bacterium]